MTIDAERAFDAQIDAQLDFIEDTLQQRAERLRQNLCLPSVQGYLSRERALILDALRASLKDGAEAAASHELARRILEE